MEWFFRPMSPGEVSIDPIQGEFFNTEAIESLSDSLVREAIQNSLDAGAPGKRVSVRIRLSGKDEALPSERALPYLKGLASHLRAPGSGVSKLPNLSRSIPYLTVEDFETVGLTGDLEQFEDRAQDTPNHFYYFWRNVGRSGKGGTARGRWGVGKYVFPACSRINTFFGATHRKDDKKTILMGQSVLRVHQLEGSRRYPYGYFGTKRKDDLVLPLESTAVLERFLHDFQLGRKDRPGLSIVIPFPDHEITTRSLVAAVIRQYYFAIAWAAVRVSVVADGRSTDIDNESLSSVVQEYEGDLGPEFLKLIALAEASRSVASAGMPSLNAGSQHETPEWCEDVFPKDLRAKLEARLREGETIGLNVPVWIRKPDAVAQESRFSVFIQPDVDAQAQRPHFFREGLRIGDVRAHRLSGYRSFVVVEDKPLAGLLGDAENPAHTEWQERSTKIREEYDRGASCIRYVKSSVAKILEILIDSHDALDAKALIDIFYLPIPGNKPAKDKTTVADPEGQGPPPPVLPPKGDKERFRIGKTSGGFSVTPSSDGADYPASLAVDVAYEVRRGDPFRRYRSADFALDLPPITVNLEQSRIIEMSGNRMHIQLLGPQFKVIVEGFDCQRDIRVRASEVEAEHEA